MEHYLVSLSVYEIKYLKGKDNVVADALSIMCIKAKYDIATTLFNIHLRIQIFIVEGILEQTKCDRLLSKVLDNIKRGWDSKISNVELSPYYIDLSTEKGLHYMEKWIDHPEKSIFRYSGNATFLTCIFIVRVKQLARSFILWPGMDNKIEEEAKTSPQLLRHQTHR